MRKRYPHITNLEDSSLKSTIRVTFNHGLLSYSKVTNNPCHVYVFETAFGQSKFELKSFARKALKCTFVLNFSDHYKY